MNKKEAEEPEEIPELIQTIGLDPVQARKLVQWMIAKDVCFVYNDNIGLHDAKDRLAHIVTASMPIGFEGERDSIVCAECVADCPCCRRPCSYLYDI